jgi:hypothetical protein
VTVADPSALIVPTLALNCAVDDPAATVTLGGTVRGAVDVKLTAVGVATGRDRATEQVLLVEDINPFGLQESELTVRGATKPTLAVCEEPL